MSSQEGAEKEVTLALRWVPGLQEAYRCQCPCLVIFLGISLNAVGHSVSLNSDSAVIYFLLHKLQNFTEMHSQCI